MIKELIFSDKLQLFESLIKIYPDNPSIVLNTLIETTTALKRDGVPIELLRDIDYEKIFKELKEKQISKEAIESILTMKSKSPDLTIDQIKEQLNIKSLPVEDLKIIINDILANNLTMIRERGMNSMGPLMGDVMKKVRGNIDGAIVSKELKTALTKKLEEM
jgi:glutamyl-tRNA(Gln) amidotransferase subunit E